MSEIEVELKARKEFGGLFETDKRWGIIVAHRRAGKTVACVQKLIKAALECEKREPRFAYIAPYYTQAKDVAWSYLKRLTAPLNPTFNESELRVDLPNGARIRLYGADNYDRLRGIYLDGVVLDEFADFPPRAWPEVIRPALSDRQGWATFIGTPKGHNEFYRIWHGDPDGEWPGAVNSPDWFAAMLRASETHLLSGPELADAKRSMSADQYAQEYECSFEAAIQGAYYAPLINEARKQGRIGKVGRDPLMPLKAFWDIGVGDATAIWVAQFVAREIRVLAYYEAVGQPLSAHLDWLRSNGFDKTFCYLPHDAAQRDKVGAVRFEDHVRAANFDVQTVANQGKGAALKRIEAGRRIFPQVWFNELQCRGGIEALSWYHERKDEERNVGLGPEHDWSSHAADAFGLMASVYSQQGGPRGAPMPKPRREWVL